MQRKLKVLFIPVNGVGHVNACTGIAQVLIDNGHEVIFFISDQWTDNLSRYGIKEIRHAEPVENDLGDQDASAFWAQKVKEIGLINDKSPLEKMINFGKNCYDMNMTRNKFIDKLLDKLLPELKPDLIVVDHVFPLTAVEISGIPWVLVCSMNPLYILEDDRTPPNGSGLATTGAQEEWREFRNKYVESKQKGLNELNDYLKRRGAQPLGNHVFINPSPYLNVYPFPRELDYTDIRPLPHNWVQFDNFMRIDSNQDFQIPDQLKDKPGKLIFFSMGSLGGADIDLMKRLIGFMANSKNRFIVAKGPMHMKYELADNMWGQQSVPQIQLLPVIDLVITHGGNNTVTETFYFGKPMIVLPLFGDQYDNAQRIQEKGFGVRVDPYRCSKQELLESIESLLNDKELNDSLKNISNRIQSENSIAKISTLIEKLVC